jgi:hypothetical protein
MFCESGITDLVGILENYNVTMNFKHCTNFNYIAQNSKITHFPNIDFNRNARPLGSAFSNAQKLVSVSFSNIHTNSTWDRAFEGCYALTDISFGGVIGNSISLSSSPLNKESITSLINALSSTSTSRTATLKKTAVNSAFETAEGLKDGSTSQEWLELIGTKSNWTISLV